MGEVLSGPSEGAGWRRLGSSFFGFLTLTPDSRSDLQNSDSGSGVPGSAANHENLCEIPHLSHLALQMIFWDLLEFLPVLLLSVVHYNQDSLQPHVK